MLELKAGLETTRQESASSVLTLRDERSTYAKRVEQSAGELVALNQQFEAHVHDAFHKVKEECGALRTAITAAGPGGVTSSSQLQINLELAALRSPTEDLNARLTVA